eukprot:CAMPEP_0181180220 /NCGR_PEP_ID=MMETSP1096-20121128/6679_1 /TAXON_ID=156174 ORGANISM="Chrysochromulina ericina, Strain CCMP281" /NCGR_SAMPLE_ID=MMETSP1096 /ASSEMBLY_ACC=CAM_ASM_000453 /LENGTH=115 /DNA_ID=CAMNT_0023268625 /DNA_START=476 /DNA_END=820 /DNA_ORIENTATION=-
MISAISPTGRPSAMVFMTCSMSAAADTSLVPGSAAGTPDAAAAAISPRPASLTVPAQSGGEELGEFPAPLLPIVPRLGHPRELPPVGSLGGCSVGRGSPGNTSPISESLRLARSA